jgi:putative ABC transport system permease protein
MTFLWEMMRLGISNLRLHKLRSFLTALGIILGVAAVITMVSVGEGSKRQALAQLERLGAKNIIIRSRKPPEVQQQSGGQRRSWMSRYGITREDMRVIDSNFGDAEAIVPLKEIGSEILKENRRQASQAYGTLPELQTVARLSVSRGRYLTQQDMDEAALVAVIGSRIAEEMFPFEDPLGNTIRIDDRVLLVVGVLSPVGLSGGAGAALVGRDLNNDVHIPITTAVAAFGDQVVKRQSGSFEASEVQVSEVYLTAPTRDAVLDYAAMANRIMDVRHPGMKDIVMIVPYELLESARKSALTAQVMLVMIAAVSLLVGGIGIMNIMLASITERTREIGIRRALGATRKHIIGQFLVETGVLSGLGGMAGVALGVGLSIFLGWGVQRLPAVPYIGRLISADVSLPTQITGWSIAVAFIVATLTGLIFGLYPAMRAAKQDPIVALRHD